MADTATNKQERKPCLICGVEGNSRHANVRGHIRTMHRTIYNVLKMFQITRATPDVPEEAINAAAALNLTEAQILAIKLSTVTPQTENKLNIYAASKTRTKRSALTLTGGMLMAPPFRSVDISIIQEVEDEMINWVTDNFDPKQLIMIFEEDENGVLDVNTTKMKLLDLDSDWYFIYKLLTGSDKTWGFRHMHIQSTVLGCIIECLRQALEECRSNIRKLRLLKTAFLGCFIIVGAAKNKAEAKGAKDSLRWGSRTENQHYNIKQETPPALSPRTAVITGALDCSVLNTQRMTEEGQSFPAYLTPEMETFYVSGFQESGPVQEGEMLQSLGHARLFSGHNGAAAMELEEETEQEMDSHMDAGMMLSKMVDNQVEFVCQLPTPLHFVPLKYSSCVGNTVFFDPLLQ